MSEQHPGAHLAAEPDGAPLDVTEQHRGEPSAAPSPADPHRPRPPAPHAGPGVEPGSDDELDAVSSGPSPTHPHEPTDTRTPGPAHEPAHPVPAPPPAASGHPVAPASPHPERWGRVDADGTVYVRTADGERAVGSWQAGEPAEGLAHYARRFDDVLTEAELLVSRLSSGGADPKHTLTSARTLRDGLAEAHVVGDRRRAGSAARRAGHAGRGGRRRAARRARRGAGRRRRTQGGAGRGGRDAGGRGDAVEAGGRPVQGDPRRVADGARHRPQDRRAAVEAVLQGS